MNKLTILLLLMMVALSASAESVIKIAKDQQIENLKARVADLEEENKILRKDLKNGTVDGSLIASERGLARKAYREHYLPLYQKMLGEGVQLPKAEDIESFKDVYAPMAAIMQAMTY